MLSALHTHEMKNMHFIIRLMPNAHSRDYWQNFNQWLSRRTYDQCLLLRVRRLQDPSSPWFCKREKKLWLLIPLRVTKKYKSLAQTRPSVWKSDSRYAIAGRQMQRFCCDSLEVSKTSLHGAHSIRGWKRCRLRNATFATTMIEDRVTVKIVQR